jgi:hypothetical protein
MKRKALYLIAAGFTTASSLFAGGFSGTSCYYTNEHNKKVTCRQSAPNLAGKGDSVGSNGHPELPATQSCGFFIQDGMNFLCNSGVDLSKTVPE